MAVDGPGWDGGAASFFPHPINITAIKRMIALMMGMIPAPWRTSMVRE